MKIITIFEPILWMLYFQTVSFYVCAN